MTFQKMKEIIDHVEVAQVLGHRFSQTVEETGASWQQNSEMSGNTKEIACVGGDGRPPLKRGRFALRRKIAISGRVFDIF